MHFIGAVRSVRLVARYKLQYMSDARMCLLTQSREKDTLVKERGVGEETKHNPKGNESK